MINKETFLFLQDLNLNNNKPWMAENKARYNTVKENIKIVTSFFEASKPLVDFLNRGIEFES
ncbi:DUF2461 family protein [Flavobacterium hercynium]|uniref:TIGR02453 family protein n=1 Tax=Flavobacterium hercynium TaxID=387094 RepID=A0A226HGW4_9FLAO|nr:DUF2461 family protein [Flavobacterium hercynium]OXA93392.1 hypothetical protein B0A66_06855 [Flavobacterium hercynium]SMP35700.1 Conserved hypothetical protein [Flavobacterium hercynium]